MSKFNTKTWFNKRGLKALDYQENIINNELSRIYTEKLPLVLAACPSAGKTIMSIAFIDKFISENPKAKVLVLTHGTTVLRSQYLDEILLREPDFTFTMIESTKDSITKKDTQVFVTLPHTITNRTKLPHFDLLVIDEAHQFSNAPMVQDIIKKIKPKYQLFLTGTPSIFIQKKYPIIPVTINELYEFNMVADVMVELASSSYDFTNEDYNASYELKNDTKFNKIDTESTLDDLLNAINIKLRSIFKNDPKKYTTLKNSIGWTAPLKALSKTMIACNNQKQALQVAEYFKSKGINVALSTSDVDDDSSEMDRFKNEKDCLVLIVVARGILGFNFPEMENVIDMTGSHNIDRIFQLMARVFRKHPKDHKKLFFKIAPKYLTEYFEHVMTCTLCLTDKEYFLKYNGKNFLDLEIPVLKKEDRKKPLGKFIKKNKVKEDIDKATIRPVKSFISGIPDAVKFFKQLLHKNDGSCESYAYVRMRDVRSELLDLQKSKGHWNKQNCKKEAFKYKTTREWIENSGSSYQIAQRNGWLEECTKHMKHLIKPKGYWDVKGNVINEARKHKSITDWYKMSCTSYNKALKMGWLEQCTKHMENIKRKPWTEIECINEARKHENITDWCQKSSGSYGAALKNGWMEQCTKHMEININVAKVDAKKYNTPTEWKKRSQKIYNKALKNGWMEQCTKHMIVGRGNGRN